MKKLLIISLVLLFCATSFGIPRSNARDAYYRIPQYISKVATDLDDDLFDVANGPIMIVDFVGVISTAMSPAETELQTQLDADTGGEDYGFSTLVDIRDLSVGNRIIFTAANPSVLTPLSGSPTGATSLFKSWICQEGMIEQNVSPVGDGGAARTTAVGAVTWFMVYIPLTADVVVTAQ